MRVPTRLLWSEWPPNDGLRPGNPYFDAIFNSVRTDGIREPLTIKLNWSVIDGAHRLEVARLLGIEFVEVHVWTGTEMILANPAALAEAIELGLAWQEAEAALPEGWVLALDQTGGGRAAAIDTHAPLGPGRAVWGDGSTPAEALRNLAAKLREANP